jgi:hypothetical protein
MQIVKVTQTTILSAAVTSPMLVELAAMVGMSKEQVSKALEQSLSKPSKTMALLEHAKLRTIVCKKLQDSTDFGETFIAGSLEVEFQCLAEIIEDDISRAGKNKNRSTAGTGKRASAGPIGVLTGAYTVAKRGLKCTVENDPEKYAMWQHIWNCTSFEQLFAVCPKKAITRTGRIITASSEVRWAVKCGWVVPVAE